MKWTSARIAYEIAGVVLATVELLSVLVYVLVAW